MAYVRYGLVAFLVYYGAFKFSAVGAENLRHFAETSPALSWMYGLVDVRSAARGMGVVEIVIAAFIALRYWSPAVCFFGSVLAMGLFALTMSFLYTTPGMFVTIADFPVPVPSDVGASLVKDFFLFGVAGWSAGEARREMSMA